MVVMCNNGSMEWSDFGAFSCGWWKNMRWMVELKNMGWCDLRTFSCLVVERKNMPLNGGRTCNGWWKYGLIWGFQLWMGQEYAVEWWKNMQWMMDVWSGVIWGLSVVDVGRICCCLVEEHAMDGGSALGCLRNMLLVVEEDAHSGYQLVFNWKWNGLKFSTGRIWTGAYLEHQNMENVLIELSRWFSYP
uniref:Candidate secreted effector n=1 Tax=Meloidogyne incognita TaxID=6306 RepID=A0A914KQU9_MELIC